MLKFTEFAKSLVAANKDSVLSILDLKPIMDYIKVHGSEKSSNFRTGKGRHRISTLTLYYRLAGIIDDALTEVDLDTFGTWAVIAPTFGDGRHVILVRTLTPDYCALHPQYDDTEWSIAFLNGATVVNAVLPELGGPDAVHKSK